MELILVRHAEPAALADDDPRRGDPPLSALGLRQADAVARWLEGIGIDGIVSGPSRRAAETAAITGRRLGLEVAIDERLRDAEDGRGTYVPIDRDRRTDREGYAARVRAYKTTDRLAEITPRVFESIEAWAEAFRGQRVAAFSHGSVVNAFAAGILGLPQQAFMEAGYASGHRFMIASSGVRSVRSLNETAYLASLPSDSDGALPD